MKVKDVMNKNFIKISPNDIGGEVVQILYKVEKKLRSCYRGRKISWVDYCLRFTYGL